MKTLIRLAVALLAIGAAAMSLGEGQGRGTGPIVYVTSQDLFFDSIVVTNLPARGRFQQLVPGGPSGLMTEWGLRCYLLCHPAPLLQLKPAKKQTGKAIHDH